MIEGSNQRGHSFLARLFAVMLVGVLTLCFGTVAYAEDTEAIASYKPNPEGVVVGGDETSDELLDAYVEQRFAEELPGSDDELKAQAAYEQLSGYELHAYNALKVQIAEVAAGERDYTIFEVPATTIYGPGWTAEDLGLESLDDVNAVGKVVFGDFSDIEFSKIIFALIADMPEELYWFNKTQTSNIVYDGIDGVNKFSFRISGDKVVPTGSIFFRFPVEKGYAAADATYVDKGTAPDIQHVTYNAGTKAKMERVNKALEKAKSIVNEVVDKGSNFYQALDAYRVAICDLVSYDPVAMTVEDKYYYGDPWQLVNVFDGDPSTMVVCEGYAKAFKYLCDLTDFDGKVECLLVDGTMKGGTGEGAHTWNVVRMDDGRNYLVDLTNCDEGTIGAPDLLFLAPISGGDVATKYIFDCGSNGTIEYVYAASTRNVFTVDNLTISEVAYGQTEQVIDIPDQVYTGEAIELSLNLTNNGEPLTEGTDFTAVWSDNVNVGTGKVTVTGIGKYEGKISVEQPFKIIPADIAKAELTEIPVQYVTGDPVEPELELTFNGKTLVKGTDYETTFSNNVEAGTASLTINGKGNFKGSGNTTFTLRELENPFVDVVKEPKETAHYNDILWLANEGISQGWVEKDGTKTFRPNDDVKRGDMAAFLFRLAQKWGAVEADWQPKSYRAFSDVTADTSHAREILWLAESGISTGWTVGGKKEFRPNINVKRGEMAAFMYRLAQGASRKGGASSSKDFFSDVKKSTSFSTEIWWLAGNEVTQGWPVGSKREFRPGNTVKRGDMAAFMHRLDSVK